MNSPDEIGMDSTGADGSKPYSIRDVSDTTGEIVIGAVEGEDFAVGAANARIEGTALVLTFIAVRETHQRRGIGGALLDYMISEGQRRGLHRFVGEDIRSKASLRLIKRRLGEYQHLKGCPETALSEKPKRMIFAPSIGILEVENDMEMTAEWPLPVAGKRP